MQEQDRIGTAFQPPAAGVFDENRELARGVAYEAGSACGQKQRERQEDGGGACLS